MTPTLFERRLDRLVSRLPKHDIDSFKERIRQFIFDVIGEDENAVKDIGECLDYNHIVCNTISIMRNELRAEYRKIIKGDK